MIIDISSEIIKIFLCHLNKMPIYKNLLYYNYTCSKNCSSYMPNQIFHLENRNAFILKIY